MAGETGRYDGGLATWRAKPIESLQSGGRKDQTKRESPADVRRTLREIVRHRFTFKESRADLELLRSIHDGTYANTKPGNPNFHAYAAAVNTASELVVP